MYELSKHYHVLGLQEGADLAEIKKAYHRLALQWHPDKHSSPRSKAHATNKFQAVQRAYEALSSELARERALIEHTRAQVAAKRQFWVISAEERDSQRADFERECAEREAERQKREEERRAFCAQREAQLEKDEQERRRLFEERERLQEARFEQRARSRLQEQQEACVEKQRARVRLQEALQTRFQCPEPVAEAPGAQQRARSQEPSWIAQSQEPQEPCDSLPAELKTSFFSDHVEPPRPQNTCGPGDGLVAESRSACADRAYSATRLRSCNFRVRWKRWDELGPEVGVKS